MRQDFVKYRRRMRGIATFFLIISVIGFSANMLLTLTSSDVRFTSEQLWERGFYAVFMFITALMAWNGSRFGAVLLFLLIVSGFWALSEMLDARAIGGLVRIVIYTGLSGALVWSAHRYHQECSIEDIPLGGSALIRWGGLALAAPALGLVIFGIAILMSPISTAVVAGSDVDQEHRVWMFEQEYLLADETIEYFYSEGLMSISEGGSLLTNKYVGGWWQDDGELGSYWVKLGEVCRIETISEGDYFTDANYKIHGAGPDNWLQLVLSVEGGGDDRFIRRMSVINERNMHAVVKAACDAGTKIDREALALANGIEPGIVTAQLVKPNQIAWLKTNKYLNNNETILKFYSTGDYHIDEGGSLLTDQYFGGWYVKQGTRSDVWAKLGEICSVEQIDQEDPSGDELYKITFGEGGWYQFHLPQHAGGGSALIKQLKSLNEAAMTDEAKVACAKQSDSPTNL